MVSIISENSVENSILVTSGLNCFELCLRSFNIESSIIGASQTMIIGILLIHLRLQHMVNDSAILHCFTWSTCRPYASFTLHLIIISTSTYNKLFKRWSIIWEINASPVLCILYIQYIGYIVNIGKCSISIGYWYIILVIRGMNCVELSHQQIIY